MNNKKTILLLGGRSLTLHISLCSFVLVDARLTDNSSKEGLKLPVGIHIAE
jgi:hypothetical protein